MRIYTTMGNWKWVAGIAAQNLCQTNLLNKSRIAGHDLHHEPSLSPLGYLRNICNEGKLPQALQYVEHMDFTQTCFSSALNCLLQGCLKKQDLITCREAYSLILKHGYESDSYLACSLIRMYALIGALPEANLVFSKVLEPDVFTWGSIISAHSKNGQGGMAIKLYHKMHMAGLRPDGHVFVAVLTACVDCADVCGLLLGKVIHSHIIESGFEPNLFVSHTLISMYGKSGCLVDARSIFRKLCVQNVVAWSAIIAVYSQHENDQEAFDLFHQMLKAGKQPDKVALASAVKACSGLATLKEGKLIHLQITENSFERDTIVGSTLVDFYAKCGSVEDAYSVFVALSKRDLVSWSSMIAGFIFNCQYKLAMQLFEDMQKGGLKPNRVIFLCLISACTDMGLFGEAEALINSMYRDHGITPDVEHLNCLVNLLSRSGCLKEAESMLQRMPFQSNVVGWTSLLASCRSYGEVELGRHCFDQIINADCRDASAYVLMANIYADAEMWEDVKIINNMKESAQAWKKPGKAIIQADNELLQFNVLNIEHSNSCFIYEKLQAVNFHVRTGGHVPLLDLPFEIEEHLSINC